MAHFSPPADLQSAIAAYMKQRPGTRLTLEDIARGVGATRGAASTMLCRIVNGEARPYPITRTGRAAYTWRSLDDATTIATLAKVIADLTGVHADLATTLAAWTLEKAGQPARANQIAAGAGSSQ
jgi:hypothetical protein